MKAVSPKYLPIGIFDSGIGGLTVAKAVVNALPNEDIIYFGDTAHLPYGDKSTATIQAYAVKIANMLLKHQCKLILIACNSASVAAFELIKAYVANKAFVMNVIDPVIIHLQHHYQDKCIGLIGTRQTVNSGHYKQKLDRANANITLKSYATNLLASAIEEFGNHPVIDSLLAEYLAHPELQHIDALLLACTHYPIIKDKIASHYKQSIHIIDSSEIVAKHLKEFLTQHDLLNDSPTNKKVFYVSDYTEAFAKHAQMFFDNDIELTHHPIVD